MKNLWQKIKKISTFKLWITYLVIKSLDLATTYYFMNHTSLKEGNPIFNYIFVEVGLNLGLMINAVGCIVLSYILYRIAEVLKKQWVFIFLNISGILVVTINFIGIAMYYLKYNL